MNATTFDIEATAGGVTIVLPREMPPGKIRDLDHVVSNHLSQIKTDVSLDISHLEILSSWLVGIFLRLNSLAKAKGARFFLLNPNEDCQALLSDAGLEAFLKIRGQAPKKPEGPNPRPADIQYSQNQGVGVLTFSGMINSGKLAEKVREVAANSFEGVSGVVIDLSTAQFIESQTLGEIVNLHFSLKGKSKKIAICGPNKILTSMLSALGLTLIFPTFGTLDEAKISFSKTT